jgi:hypothetical protein
MADAEPQPASTNPDRSFLQQVRGGEQHWAWKFSFRVAICIFDIVGIGCAAWLTNQSIQRNNYYLDYLYFDYFMLPGSLTAVCPANAFAWLLSSV